jgi:hypothetical protein
MSVTGSRKSMRRRRGRLAGGLLVVALAIVAALIVAPAGSGGSAQATAVRPALPMQLRVMEFNIEYGGTQVSFKKVVEAVKKADPDVLGIEEAETHTGRLARLAGYPYFNAGMQIVSKYPIIEPSGSNGAYAFIEVTPGRVVAISNVHLPSGSYGPYYMLKGMSEPKLMANETRVRLPAIQPQLTALPPLATAGIPVFVTGDFNSPSALDYTAATVGLRPQVKYPFAWPVSQALLDAGFRDSWRDVYPDPVTRQGITWPAHRPKVYGWNPGKKACRDRIDFIYASGPSTTTSAQLAGEAGRPRIAYGVKPWPSDHRAVVSTFQVTPGVMPVLVAVDRLLVTQGQDLKVTFHAPGSGPESVGLVTPGGDPNVATLATQSTGVVGTIDGVLTFPTAALAPGAYEAVLYDSTTVLARVQFWVRAVGAKVTLSTDKATYASGEPIVVGWQNAPANRWDWLGIYKASAANPNVDWYLDWQYTGGALSGTMHGMPAGSFTFEATGHQGGPWPLPAGKYVVYYLLADAYQAAAHANFTVTK